MMSEASKQIIFVSTVYGGDDTLERHTEAVRERVGEHPVISASSTFVEKLNRFLTTIVIDTAGNRHDD